MFFLQKQQKKVNSLIRVRFLLLHPTKEEVKVDFGSKKNDLVWKHKNICTSEIVMGARSFDNNGMRLKVI